MGAIDPTEQYVHRKKLHESYKTVHPPLRLHSFVAFVENRKFTFSASQTSKAEEGREAALLF